jgi:hypothetical protein
MKPAVVLLRRWQAYNPASGQFDMTRTNRDYAELLGIHESSLSKIYAGLAPVGLKPLAGLAHAFPQAAPELARMMTGAPVDAAVVEVA